MNFLDKVDFNRFLGSLQYMWKGMLCIFIVIGVIIVTVSLLSKFTSKKDETDTDENQ